DASLLQEFRTRTLSGAQLAHVRELIRRLGDESFPVREQASAQLAKLGKSGAALLRAALDSPDAEVRHRAQRCLDALAREDQTTVPALAARLVALRKPAGATEALLAFLPFTADEAVHSEVESALVALAWSNGRPEPALLSALKDPVPVRRA